MVRAYRFSTSNAARKVFVKISAAFIRITRISESRPSFSLSLSLSLSFMRIIQYSNHEQARLHRVFASLCSENEQRRVERNTAKFAYKFSGKCTLRGVVQVGGHFKQFDREGEREITRYSTARCSRRRVKRMDTFCPI